MPRDLSLLLPVCVLVIFAGPLWAETVAATGTIGSVDAKAGTITVRRKTAKGEKTATLNVRPSTPILNDTAQPTHLGSLAEGDHVELAYDTKAKAITKIQVIRRAGQRADGTTSAEGNDVLFNGKDLDGWSHVPGGSGRQASAVWSVDGPRGVLRCLGSDDHSKLVYRDDFGNFTFKLQWRIPPGSTISQDGVGVLVRASRPDATVQRSIAFQLNDRPNAASWVLGQSYDTAIGEKSNDFDGRLVLSSAKRRRPVGEWNDLEIRCSDRNVTIRQNGEDPIRLTNADASAGAIMLRSQGTVMEFRNVVLQRHD